MVYPKLFIQATENYSTLERAVPAPYIRKRFSCDCAATAEVVIACCGFYELYINGKRYTKGFLAPYISNTDHYIYCDRYEVPLDRGENVIGLWLGNGFQNNPGGYIWDFDKSPFRSAPMVALALRYQKESGEEVVLHSDATFKTAPSPIRFDDYRFGEIYDANFEIPSWNEKGFDDSAWTQVLEAVPPKGEMRLCQANPIVAETELKPVRIFKEGDSYIYDFGVCHAGVCRLCVNGVPGQKIGLQHADQLENGKFSLGNLWFRREGREHEWSFVHKDTYVCKGHGQEVYTPTFTYHGFRYVKVDGITPGQATEDLLTFVVLHSRLNSRGSFRCSNETVNTLQEVARRSVLSNFHYFPTDCPHREKNGWTADAALSCEYTLLNFDPETDYREWLRNICKAQDENGALPGIVPTGGWGFDWGNGPAWDCVLAYLPYFVYVYRGETDMILDAAGPLMRYLKYLRTRYDDVGLIHFGLGDWCHVGNTGSRGVKAPLPLTDSVMAMDIANKAAAMFGAVGMTDRQAFAQAMAAELKQAIRAQLIDFDTCTAAGCCQSSQVMCLFYGIFTPEEEPRAFERLLELIHAASDHMDVGVLGGRVLFHVLSRFGFSDLALKMIVGPEYPSYGNWLERGATTFWEDFAPDTVSSTNHHFWGDISGWFIQNLAGIQFNPTARNIHEVTVRPAFVEALDYAQGDYTAPAGKIVSSWKRCGRDILLTLTVPDGMTATAVLPMGFRFEDGRSTRAVTSGQYTVLRIS